MNKTEMLGIVRESIATIKEKRYFETERGYQAELYCKLKTKIDNNWIVSNKVILESESQKTQEKHQIIKRPDIILHIPYEYGQTDNRSKGNFLVIQLKLRASEKKAKEDFAKLDDMFKILDYPLGMFLNIDSDKTFYNSYSGDYRDRLACFAVKLINGDVVIKKN